MKRLLFAAAALAAPFFFFSCEKPDDNGGGKEPGTGTETEAPVLNNTTEGDISVPCEGGSFFTDLYHREPSDRRPIVCKE